MSGVTETIGYLGLGLMGGPMVRRMLRAGYQVTVWNRSADKVRPLVEAGAVAAESPAAVARASRIVMMCLTDARAVERVIFGDDGAAGGVSRDSVFVDFSSIRPDVTRDIAARLAAQSGAHWIDAPVSGGVPGAEAGTLAIMAGGAAAAVERVRPIIAHLAARFTHMGPSGAGQTTKLINQVLVSATFVALAEAFRLAEAAGVDAARIPECLKGGFADSIPLQVFGPRIAARKFDPPLGHADTLLKDLDTARDLAREVRSPLPLASLAAELLRMLTAHGRGNDEPSALIDVLGAPP